jgi:hypothetical protein
MTRDELAQLQREQSSQMLFSLAMSCRRRFLLSADLVGMRGAAVDKLRAFGVRESVDLAPLIPAWRCLCERYLTARYDPQLGLFEDHRTQVETGWERFVYHELLPELVRNDDLVRNVLRSLGGLPCQSRGQAASAVYQYILEMVLPAEAPPWAPEEEIDL